MGMTQADLGAALDPPRSLQQVQKYEAGTNRVSSTAALQICEILKIPLAELLDIDSRKGRPMRRDDHVLQVAAVLLKLSPKARRALLKLAQALS